MSSSRQLDLDAGGLLLALTVCALSPFAVTRALAMPLALTAPGLALLLALFGRRPGLRGIEVVCQSLVLSLALAIATGLALDVAGVRLSRLTVLLALVLCGASALVVARTRDPRPATAPWEPWLSVSVPAVVTAGLLIAVVLAALVARAVLPSAPATRFAVLRLQSPSSAIAAALPIAGGRASITVQVVNRRSGARRFSVAAGAEPGWPAVVVKIPAGGARSILLSGPIRPAACPQRVQVTATDLSGGRSLSLDLYTAATAPATCPVPQVTR